MSGNFFGELRQLANKVDKGSHDVKEKMSGQKKESGSEEAILLICTLQKEMTALYAEAKKSLEGIRNDGGFMEAVPLCQTIVVKQAEKLSKIEEYLAKYGYITPNNLSEDPSHVECQLKPQSTIVSEGNTDKIDKRSPDRAISAELDVHTPQNTKKKGSDSSQDRTPQPEDFGISPGMLRKYASYNKGPKGIVDSVPQQPMQLIGMGHLPLETPLNFQHKGLRVTPGLMGCRIPDKTPAQHAEGGGMYFSRGGTLHAFEPNTISALNFSPDKSPETPVFQTPGIAQIRKNQQGNINLQESFCCSQDEEDTVSLLYPDKKAPQLNLLMVEDSCDNSPIPPVLTSGVVHLPNKKTVAKLGLEVNTGNEDTSPVPPVLVTPAAKKKSNHKDIFKSMEPNSEDNSPVIPVFTTPGIKISQHLSTGSNNYKSGAESQDTSPAYPVLEALKTPGDIRPVFKSMCIDDDLPQTPELRTIDLKTLCQAATRGSKLLGRNLVNSEILQDEKLDTNDYDETPLLTQMDKSKLTLHTTSLHGQCQNLESKENYPPSDLNHYTQNLPTIRLKELSEKDYETLPAYVTHHLSLEAINNTTHCVNDTLARKKAAGYPEDICPSDIERHLGSKTKMFILAMRPQLESKGAGTDKFYVVSAS